ncbi:hypothetical protein WOLCODRAFT_62488 [Wolfiporia cocos MD-104 SS10]|uniref:Amidohydrolase-related domain-containing protein n=1 Tax=Wolfiporia cocos (strain MD-104) TaxID=742152 RepID=A0A2H3IWH7_WOLCO|nr:hypothetical protein WOLCODRAFT_62488 [Wolfiporia cocos MD-104 SS10]
MPLHSSLLEDLPYDVLAHVATELALLQPLGPPAALVPLLLTCRHVHDALCVRHAPDMWARVFRAKFDTRAPLRRLGARTARSSHQVAQLKKLSRALTRIRRGDIYDPGLEADLWTAFVMYMENDGRNEAHLEWANVHGLVDSYIRTRLWENRHNGWPAETATNSLAIWVMWCTLTADRLRDMSAAHRSHIMDLIRPYVLTALRYPSFHAPDNHFDFPLPAELQEEFPYTLMTPHGFYPLYRQPESLLEEFPHFGISLGISAPLIAQGAKLLYMTMYQTHLPHHPGLPPNREHAQQQGLTHVGPTREDIDEANAHHAVRLVERGDWDWRSRLTPDEGRLEDDGAWRRGLRAMSARWDNDWNRLTGCIDPWDTPELKGVVYTYGTLDGLWSGRLLTADVNQYFALVTATEFPADFSLENPRMATSPLYMLLREHHCVSPAAPVPHGGSGAEFEFDDGVCNAWFPQVEVRERDGRVRIEDRRAGRTHEYETYAEGRANSHDAATCRVCIADRAEEAEIDARMAAEARDRELVLARRAADAALGRSADEVLDVVMGDAAGGEDAEDDEYVDGAGGAEEEYIVNTCNGVTDIIVTGETLPRHGQAWHHYRFYGRVRRWDGLVAIVRVPMYEPQFGVYIFRGYVHGGRNFVGSWRSHTNNPHAIPLEGPFIMSKPKIVVLAGRLFDPTTLALRANQAIVVSRASGLVLDVRPIGAADAAPDGGARDAETIDLRGATVLPGLVDAHVHLFLRAYAETSWEDQVARGSAAERSVRAGTHARRTLMAGYTAVRDLGSEGVRGADVRLRALLAGPAPLVPGPRYFCANRALVTTNTYGPKSRIHVSRDGVDGVTGAEVVDGEAECIKAVRRQVGGGADWVKRMAGMSPAAALADIATFNRKELDAIVSTSHQLGVKVAAHAAHWNINGSTVSSGPGFHTIEHGYSMLFDSPDAPHLQVYKGDVPGIRTFWVPTLAAYYSMRETYPHKWEGSQRAFREALARGVDDIACGGDTGVFSHGANALEMKLMVRLGADWRRVLRWGTLRGWECIRSMAWEGARGAARLARVEELGEDPRLVGDNEVPFGAIRRGFAADIIATTGDLERDFESAVDAGSIVFVMKGGRVYKQDGQEVMTGTASTTETIVIYAGKLFDPESLELTTNRVITVAPDSGLIVALGHFTPIELHNLDFSDPQCIDLRSATVFPGLVDAHVHLFLHPYSEVSWEDQLTQESLVERTVRAALHAKRTLMAGYTAVRDLGTEGAGDADIHLRKCMSGPNPLIPGPRYFCANRAIVTTGSYGPKSKVHLNQEGVEGITGAEVADGEVECIKAVRRQVGAGADWIKSSFVIGMPLDYRYRARMSDVSTSVSAASIPTFNNRELKAIVSTASKLGVKVAAHAAHWQRMGSEIAGGPGVHSIEHGYDMTSVEAAASEGARDGPKKSETVWVPTLAAYYTLNRGRGGAWDKAADAFKTALQSGVENIACGGDTGVFAHGDNALEMKLMVRLGADWRRVLRWGTLGGWKCIRSMAWEGEAGEARLSRLHELLEDARVVGDNEVPFGVIRPGFAADIAATSGDLDGNFEMAVDKSSIVFVMKGGRVYKRDGRESV